MSATEAIASLGDLVQLVERITTQIRADADRVEQRWEGLRQAGGRRDDHGAALLEKILLPDLKRMKDFCWGCIEQVEAVIQNPFGEEARR